jgi:hypothetical protein
MIAFRYTYAKGIKVSDAEMAKLIIETPDSEVSGITPSNLENQTADAPIRSSSATVGKSLEPLVWALAWISTWPSLPAQCRELFDGVAGPE